MIVFCNQIMAQNEKEILWTADWSSSGKFIAIGKS